MKIVTLCCTLFVLSSITTQASIAPMPPFGEAADTLTFNFQALMNALASQDSLKALTLLATINQMSENELDSLRAIADTFEAELAASFFTRFTSPLPSKMLYIGSAIQAAATPCFCTISAWLAHAAYATYHFHQERIRQGMRKHLFLTQQKQDEPDEYDTNAWHASFNRPPTKTKGNSIVSCLYNDEESLTTLSLEAWAAIQVLPPASLVQPDNRADVTEKRVYVAIVPTLNGSPDPERQEFNPTSSPPAFKRIEFIEPTKIVSVRSRTHYSNSIALSQDTYEKLRDGAISKQRIQPLRPLPITVQRSTWQWSSRLVLSLFAGAAALTSAVGSAACYLLGKRTAKYEYYKAFIKAVRLCERYRSKTAINNDGI
jgi:hypothetical protein